MCGHMQQSHEDLKKRLLDCVDGRRNVINMETCLAVITALENMSITQKGLEKTRLGLHVNEIRRKTKNIELGKRLKLLVKKWRTFCTPAHMRNGISQKAHRKVAKKTGRRPISPPLSAPNRPNSRGELSPYSLPSSGNASPGTANVRPNSSGNQERNVSPSLSLPGNSNAPRVNSPLTLSISKPSASKVNNSSQNVASVSKTIAANKRMRKDDVQELPPSKRTKTGVANGIEDDCSRDSIYSTLSCDRTSRASNDAPVVVESQPVVVRRSGRRRKSQNDPQQPNSSGLDSLKQKMAVIGTRPSKVKTTSQIVADLAKKKGDKQLARRASILGQVKDQRAYLKDDHVSKNKLEHMHRFLKSQPESVIDEITLVDDDDVQVLSPQSSTSSIQIIEVKDGKNEPFQQNAMSPPSNMDLLGINETDTADEILARLPPLDFSKLCITDYDETSNSSSSDDDSSCDEVERLIRKSCRVDKSKLKNLHTVDIECQNGTYDMDARFKEWNEVVTRKSYQDTPLVILPYVVTEF